jgi:hypothetical protein
VIAAARASGDIRSKLDGEAAAALFIGGIQGLVMQALIAGDMSHMNEDAPRIFAIYRRGIAADNTDQRGA